jgi:TetR/AcrR family transcriptional regulator, regulator of autoinduction and epiphytic fitness
VLDVSFVGDEPGPLHQRSTARAAAAETDAGRMLDGYARRYRKVLERSAPLHHVLRSAAAVDPEAAALLARVEHQRLMGQSGVARALADRGALADGVTEDEARDVIFTMMSPEVHRILTVQRGWSPDRYESWLARSLRALLLPHALEALPRRRRA